MKKARPTKKVTTVASRLVKTKGKQPVNPKKKGENQAAMASAVDLRQPKDRDPIDPIQESYVDLLDALKPLFANGLFSSDLVSIGLELSFEFLLGNKLFDHWLDKHTEMWNQQCDRFDAPYDDFDGMNTVEGKVDLLFEQLGEWEHVLHLLATSFDVESKNSHNSDYYWSVRCLAIRVAQFNPFSFFDVDTLETDPASANQHRFFDHNYEPGNPRLRHERPVVRFWIMCSALFHHPWASDLDDYLDYTECQHISVFAKQVLEKINPSPNDKPKKKRPHNKYILDSDDNDSDDEDDNNSGEFIEVIGVKSPPTKAYKNRDLTPMDDSAVSEDDADVGRGFKKFSNRFYLDDDDDDEDDDDEDDDDNDEDGKEEGANDVGSIDDEEEPEPPEKRARSGPNSMVDSANWPDLPAAEPRMEIDPVQPGKGDRALSVAEKIDRLRQVNLDGLQCNCTIFEISMGMNWSGVQAGADTLPTAWVKHVLVTLAEALNNSTDGLLILPILDGEYKNKQLWIKNEQDLRRYISTYRDLSKYIDLNYGNATWAATNVKPGDKKLRTRVRAGYNIGVDPLQIQQFLHVGLQPQGRGTGCYASPLQFGTIEKIGGLCFYPPEMNSADMEKELMREFQWLIPVGLRTEWVNMPYNGRMKWNDREPGIMLWHVYVPSRHAKHVDAVLRKWLNPLTAKKHLPFAASVHYISDWKAAQAGKISVQAYGPIKEQIITMVSKARDFQDLTVVLFSDLDHGIHGMLKKVMTRKFGESSLLKLLLSIKATPKQATIAVNTDLLDTDNPSTDSTKPSGTDSSGTNTNPQDNGKDGEDSDNDNPANNTTSFKIVKSKRKKLSKKSSLDTEPNDSGMSAAQKKAEAKADRKRQQDLDNNRPSPLFSMILPGEMVGSYIFLCRRKFATLGKNVLSGLVAFLTHHLMELTTQQNDRVLAKWISRTTIDSTRRKNLQWCVKELRAREITQSERDVEQALEFLDDVVEDPMDVWEGSLEILTSMADYNDIDDGATVAGALDELNEKECQLADALTEISIKETALHEANRQHMAERLERQRLEQKIKLLEAATNATEPVKDRAPAPTTASPPTGMDRPTPDSNPQVTPDRLANGQTSKRSPISRNPESSSTTHRGVNFAADGPPNSKASKLKNRSRLVQSAQSQSRRHSTTPMSPDHATGTSRPITQFFKQCGKTRGNGLGDNSLRRQPSSTRVVFQNVNGVPKLGTAPKQLQINSWLRNEQVGIALLAETNRRWPSLPEGHRWNDRMRKACKTGFFATSTFNRQRSFRRSRSSFQYGGTTTTLFNDVSHSAKESGQDPAGLGRWSYIRIRGKKKSQSTTISNQRQAFSNDVVVIAAYRPNEPGVGQSTVWAQHRRYLHSIHRKIDPREAFVVDLVLAIQRWRNEGCEVILGVDANEDVSANSPTSFRNRMRQAGLQEAILHRHPSMKAATYQRNTKDTPIDGIFVSSGIPVVAGGYYGFEEFISSDHRGLWIDIDLAQALGKSSLARSTFKPRKLTLLDKRSVRKYINLAQDGYKKYDILGRLEKLEKRVQRLNGMMTAGMQRQFNCIHRQTYAIRRNAEALCRKQRMGKVPWSPPMQALWDRLALWKMLLKGRRKCRVSSRKIRRLLNKTKEPDAWKLSTTQLEAQLKKTKSTYKRAKKQDAARWRRDHIDVQVKAARRKKKRSPKARERFLRLRRMKQREESRRRRRAQQKGATGGLRAIQVGLISGDASTLHTITEQHLVEEGCMQENRRRYDQTRHPWCTPPMQEPLYSAFRGPLAEENSMSLLHGAYSIPEDTDPATTSFLSHCRFRKDHHTTKMSVDTCDHQAFWAKNPENKGSEPHGLHNGHFKAGIQSTLLASCDAMIRNIPIISGFVPDLWKNLMNFAIEKKPGDFRVERMRTIQLMNAEFQANNKKAGRLAMSTAEAHNLIPSGQCGSRKNHQAIDLALSKRLVWDLLILQRRSAGWISNDAKSCFDRVVHWVAVLALLRFGLTWRTVSMMFNTLATSTHRVRTGFGDSTRSFHPPSDIPFQGCGQGNGAGPAIWVAVSSILIIMMEAKGFGFECLSAITSSLVTAQCFCFVDDTDVIESSRTVDHSGDNIMASVQAAASLWAGGIRATGGAINPEKSFWWLIDFKWDGGTGQWKFCRKSEVASNKVLKIPGLSGATENLPRLEPDESKRTLGVMLAPLENLTAHERYLRQIAKDWAERVRSGSLHRYDVFPLIKTTVAKSLEYPSPLTTLDEATWLSIMSPVLQVCLPKAGICRNFPRSMALAPSQFQGLGLPNMFGIQVFKHLEAILRHFANHTKTGAYLSAVLQSHQLETGTSFGLLQQVYSNTAVLASDTWLKRVWSELETLDCYIVFDSPALELRRSGDRLLMDLFMDLEVDQDVLLWLNWCRLYLHVCTVSDIVTADGRRIRKTIWEGNRDDSDLSPYHWPRSVRPSSRHWESWRLHVSQALLLSYGLQYPLRCPLGAWTDSLDNWLWLYSPTHGLFQRNGSVWRNFVQVSLYPNGRNYEPSPDPLWHGILPSDVQRATVCRIPRSTTVQLTGSGTPIEAPPAPAPSLYLAWKNDYDRVTDRFGWVPDSISIIGSESALVEALLAGRLRVVSDGSYKAGLGTAAVHLSARTGADKILVKCQTPGAAQDQSPYRSELIGLLAGIMVVDWLLVAWAPSLQLQPRVKIACDGLSALQNSFRASAPKPTQAQFDLLSSIRESLRRSSARWLPRHVHGHVEDTVPLEDLDWWELRNLEMDALAVDYRKELEANGFLVAPNTTFFSEPAALYIGTEKQSHITAAKVQEMVSLPHLRQRWNAKGTLSCTAETEVDWKSMRRAMQSLPPGIQRWTTKHTVGMCGVGKFMKLWGFQSDAACPRCGLFEDHLHVPRCQAPTAVAEWEARTLALASWLDIQQTDPSIKQAILVLLRGIHNPGLPSSRVVDPLTRGAFRSQQLIGYQGLLEGRISTQWLHLQQTFLRKIQSRRSASLWASRLIQQLIMLGFYMWEHRNVIKHSDDDVQLRERSIKTNDGIHSQFDMGTTDLPPNIRKMLSVNRHQVLKMELADREDWLQTLVDERRAVRRALAPQRRILRRFLKSDSPPT